MTKQTADIISYANKKSHFDWIYCYKIIIKMVSKMDAGQKKFTVKSFIATWLKVNKKQLVC